MEKSGQISSRRFSQTNVILTEEKGVQSKCDGGTMSAALNINTDSDALLYTGVFFYVGEVYVSV